MESFATPYQVVFYDGEQEHDKGVVGVHSVLSFKRFQALMSQKTGIPANQLSAVFVCRRTLRDTDHKRQKLPISENTNFNIILNQHNPSREKDCHFLVSIKKSKKERKGSTRKQRNADQAESYADDEDSNSSRGDLSPMDERPKPNSNSTDIHEPIFSPDQATSPSSVFRLQRNPNSPPTTPISLPNASQGHRFCNMSSPYGSKVTMTAPEGIKVERTLLRREAMGQNGFASPRSAGWQNGRVGFSLSSSAGKGESLQNHGDNKPWMQLEDGRDSSVRQSEKMISGQADAVQQPHQHIFKQGQLVDLFLQDRFNDPMRPGSSGLSRNSLPMTSSSPLSRPSNSANSPGAVSNGSNFLPRVPMVTGTQSNSLMQLQQARAHLSHLQQQQQHQHQNQHHHHQQTSSMTPLEFSKLSGVLRGLVGRETSRSADAINSQKVNNCHRCQAPTNDLSEFHWCVNDTITMGFRGPSPAGPIGRPGKRHVEAAA